MIRWCYVHASSVITVPRGVAEARAGSVSGRLLHEPRSAHGASDAGLPGGGHCCPQYDSIPSGGSTPTRWSNSTASLMVRCRRQHPKTSAGPVRGSSAGEELLLFAVGQCSPNGERRKQAMVEDLSGSAGSEETQQKGF